MTVWNFSSRFALSFVLYVFPFIIFFSFTEQQQQQKNTITVAEKGIRNWYKEDIYSLDILNSFIFNLKMWLWCWMAVIGRMMMICGKDTVEWTICEPFGIEAFVFSKNDIIDI